MVSILWYSFLWLPVVGIVLFLARIVLFKTGLIYMVKKWRRTIMDVFHVYQFYKVPEFNDNLQENHLYMKVYEYLNSLSSIEDSDFTNLFTGKKSNEIILRLDRNQVVGDEFLGVRVCWINGEGEDGARRFVLKIRKADKRRILGPYLQHIHTVTDELEQRNTELKLFMNVSEDEHGKIRKKNVRWRSIPFNHPCTFDNIAMETDLKNKVKSDLESFLKGRQYYNRLGRVWKRSYLLYGPSGTGKSSFVAAMAKFLDYNVYDIDLSRVRDDSDLKMLLLQTRRKSVIVIEDLDRFISSKSTTAVSVSGILNFTDSILTSCAADERITVFTMAGKEQMDPAMIRPGRVDVHIHFPLCDFTAFKTLASNYLGVREHKLFPQVEGIFQSGASLSTAEIGELMIANRSSPTRALRHVISALQIDGDRRGNARRSILESGSRRSTAEDGGDKSGPLCGGGGGSSPAVKELRKLYGLLRIKSSRKSESFDVGSCNFAFVQFATQDDATKALDCTQNSKIMDRVVSIEYALKDDDERDDRNAPSPRRRSPSPVYRRRPSPDYGRPRSPEYDRYKGPASYERRRSPDYRRRSPEYGRTRSPCYDRYRRRSPIHRARG
ncbi:hypothetical protein Bca4012_081303 [Brassica carinata]